MSIQKKNIKHAHQHAELALQNNIKPDPVLLVYPESDLAKIVKILGSPMRVKELLALLEQDFMKFLVEDCGISPTNYIMTLLAQDYNNPFQGFLYVADGQSKNLLEGLPSPNTTLLNQALPVCFTSVLVLFFYKKLLQSKIISGPLSEAFMLAYGLINKEIIEKNIRAGKVFIEMNPIFMEHGMFSHVLQLSLIAIAVNSKKIKLDIDLSALLPTLVNQSLDIIGDNKREEKNFWDYSLDLIVSDEFNTAFALNLFLLLFENETYLTFRKFWIGNYIQSYQIGQKLTQSRQYSRPFQEIALNISRSGVPHQEGSIKSLEYIQSQYRFEHDGPLDSYLFTLKRLPPRYCDIADIIYTQNK